MKYLLNLAACVAVATILSGCEPSAQEKIVQQQVQVQKGLENNLKVQQEKLKNIPPMETQKIKPIELYKRKQDQSSK